jgi:hypothetical protein
MDDVEAVPFDDLQTADLVVDRVYRAGPFTDVRADPLQRLLPVGNQGGFRYKGEVPRPRLVVLYTTGAVAEWPDEIDETTGTVTYYGDNKHPGRAIHDTVRRGNRILQDTFLTYRESAGRRASLPVYLMFQSLAPGRDVQFRGLLVPGSPLLDRDEELNAVWRSESGERFQNYRAKFTVLDTDAVSRHWIEDVLSGQPLTEHAPTAWIQWVETMKYRPLAAPPISPIRSKEDQLPAPDDRVGWSMLEAMYANYSPRPVAFERAAVAIAQLAVPLPTAMDVTRPSMDGGRDAVGRMLMGHQVDPVWINIALEAKCYAPGQHSVGVKETSRLISRLKYRDLGFMVTTSYVARQAYEELREDRHPVVVLSGGDLVRELRRRGIASPHDVNDWLRQFE